MSKKAQLSAPKAGNVFGNDDDSEEEEGTDWVKKALKAENEKNKIKRQTQLNMQKALSEDATIFQYDEVYDEIERAKVEEKKSDKKVQKKPKYIQNLLKSADLRKKEQELRKERIIQKEIEAEDAMFPDKERFVTSSYKAKLEEMQKFEKEQENQDRLEAIGDVMKQNDMSGFYRHLYRQTVEKNEADLGIVSQPDKSIDKSDGKSNELKPDIDKDDPIPSNSEFEISEKSESEDKKDISKESSIRKRKNLRQYRKRVEEASESESDREQEKDKNENIADKTENLEKNENKEANDNELKTSAKKPKLSDDVETIKFEENSKFVVENKNSDVNLEKVTPKDNAVTETAKEIPKPKKKINIWQKRTVGPVFEAALERYLIRKKERLVGS